MVTMATMGGNLGIGAAAVAAHAAATLFNNHHGNHINSYGNIGMWQGIYENSMKFGKPLTDLPGPSTYWPGVVTEDWHKILGMHR